MTEKIRPVAFASTSDLEAMADGYVFAGVSCKPMGHGDVALYTADQVRELLRRERKRVTAVIRQIGADWQQAGVEDKFYATEYLERAIRALPDTEVE